MKHSRTILPLIVAWVGLGTGTIATAAVESVVIRIDSSTVQPIDTGLVPTETGELIVVAEGAVQPFSTSTRLTEGNFGADGETRFARTGQPIFDGMPYGAVIGRLGSGTLPTFQFLGSVGVTTISTNDIGDELRLGLNMSDADLAGMTGAVVVTAIFVPDGSPEVAQIDLHASSAYPVPTGLIAEPGDNYVTIALGGVRQSILSGDGLIDGWFGPPGKIRFNRSGQPLSEGPYGGVYATYSVPGAGFFLGDAGAWSTQPADGGAELSVFLNMSETDQAAINGTFRVWVIRLPEPTTAVEGGEASEAATILAYPNPTAGSMQLRYALPASDRVVLRVYDASGRTVRTLVDGTMSAGSHEGRWDGADESGDLVVSGTYFYQLSTSNGSQVGRVVIAR